LGIRIKRTSAIAHRVAAGALRRRNHHRGHMHAGAALAAAALAFEFQLVYVAALNIDAVFDVLPYAVARNPSHHATVLQNAHVEHGVGVDQLLRRAA
jgi:hypothetical protein